jgi:ABC-2 type transport system permease protein
MREWRERIGSRTFVLFSILGPLTVLTILYMLFAYGGKTATKWNVLITDPSGIMADKIASRTDSNIRYSFADNYIEIEEFANGKRYQQYDAMVEINEKVLSNKIGFVFYRQIPSKNLEKKVQYQVERRLEEVLVKRFTELSLTDFKKIKQPLNLSFRNVYDPHDFSQDKRAWVGLFLGLVIFVFIALFAMGLMRSISREKSNRIVEVLLGSVRPVQLMFGKILGIGMAAIFQFSIWFVTIAIGLTLMRNTLFPDYISANLENGVQVTEEVQNSRNFEKQFEGFEYNEFVDLVFERVQFGPMITAFVFCLIGGYLFYSSLFAAVGASVGSESDGQQFVIPLVLLLCLGVYAGYYAMINPQGPLTSWFYYLPFTSPAVVLVKLAQGFNPGEAYSLILVGFILLISSIVMLWISGRIYKNGILQFGHRLKLRHFFKWTKQV